MRVNAVIAACGHSAPFWRHGNVLAICLLRQSNYGFGGTYWSYGREDNGSLPLNWLTTDHALLDWGLWDLVAAHVGFYFDNYVDPETGNINFYTWGALGEHWFDTF